MSAAPTRAFLLTGGRLPDARRARPGDVALDVGADRDLPDGVRRIPGRDLLPAGEAEALMRGAIEIVTSWHREIGVPEGLILSPWRAVETPVLHEFAQALKHLVLLRRLAEIVGACEVVADPAHPALRPLPPLLLGDPAPIALRFAADPWLARSLRSLWLRRRAASTPRGAGLGDRPRGAIGADPGRIRVWWLVNSRNRALLDAARDDPRLSIEPSERVAENRYLGEDARPRAAPAPGAIPLGTLTALLETRARESLPTVPRAGALLAGILDRVARARAPAAEAEARLWSERIAGDRPDLIVCGIPWDGDLRVLALVAARERVPLAACQDGALAETGAGGIPVASAALAWGPRGSDWFARRGVPRASVRQVGDPHLDRLVREVARTDAAPLRARLRIPPGTRALLAGVQNSAPHLPASDPADPLRLAAILVEAAGRSDGWRLVLKPHPRLPLVDGPRRMRRLREIAARSACVSLVPPDEPLAPLLALADAHVGEGDTLSLEALACGKPSILFEQEGLPPVYPEYAATGAMPAVRSPDELAALLGGGAPPIDPSARARLLDEHLRAETPAADALVSLARAHGARPEPAP